MMTLQISNGISISQKITQNLKIQSTPWNNNFILLSEIKLKKLSTVSSADLKTTHNLLHTFHLTRLLIKAKYFIFKYVKLKRTQILGCL